MRVRSPLRGASSEIATVTPARAPRRQLVDDRHTSGRHTPSLPACAESASRSARAGAARCRRRAPSRWCRPLMHAEQCCSSMIASPRQRNSTLPGSARAYRSRSGLPPATDARAFSRAVPAPCPTATPARCRAAASTRVEVAPMLFGQEFGRRDQRCLPAALDRGQHIASAATTVCRIDIACQPQHQSGTEIALDLPATRACACVNAKGNPSRNATATAVAETTKPARGDRRTCRTGAEPDGA